MEDHDVTEALRVLEALIVRCEAGELHAEPLDLAAMRGALAALESLDGSVSPTA
ncbi:hypothetical protein GCM10023258_34210 [Terrabacter aeriphilus]|uniref:Uncharacterized protein n=1 Tax=Terrabacter aeriphilus TaxID=515662 RepID=A0ABP9JL82_9MICO